MPVVQQNSSRLAMQPLLRGLRTNNELPRTSEINRPVRANRSSHDIRSAEAGGRQSRVPAEQQQHVETQVQQSRTRTLEQDLDRLLSRIFPDHGVRFNVHDSGVIFATIVDNVTEEVVREFPAEKILDIIHNMVQNVRAAMERRSYPPVPGGGRAVRVPAEYADTQMRRTVANDLDRLIRQIFPDNRGEAIEIYDSGVILIGNGLGGEVAREFPAEQNLDIIYSMTQGLGTVLNRKI